MRKMDSNLNISPEVSYDVLDCDIVMFQNYMLWFCNKRLCNKNSGRYWCRPLYTKRSVAWNVLEKPSLGQLDLRV